MNRLALKKVDGIVIKLRIEAASYDTVYIKGMKRIRKFFGKNIGRELVAVPIQIEEVGKNRYEVYYSVQSVLLKETTNKKHTYMSSFGNNMMYSVDYYKQIEKHFNNANYRIGRAYEYRGMKAYRKKGWYTKRSFGSKGAEDFIAYRHGICHFIQSKFSRKNATKPEDYPSEMERLKIKAKKYGAIAVFHGVKENRRMYFINLFTMQEILP